LAFAIYIPKRIAMIRFLDKKHLNHIHLSFSRPTKINTENPRQLHPSPFPIVSHQLTLASNFVADPFKDHIPDFKEIKPRFFTIIPPS
jgi:hypothetical protein